MSTLRLTKPQTQAVTAPRGNLLVAAAAGSGKTAVLSQRVLRHLTEEPMIPANRAPALKPAFTKSWRRIPKTRCFCASSCSFPRRRFPPSIPSVPL